MKGKGIGREKEKEKGIEREIPNGNEEKEMIGDEESASGTETEIGAVIEISPATRTMILPLMTNEEIVDGQL